MATTAPKALAFVLDETFLTELKRRHLWVRYLVLCIIHLWSHTETGMWISLGFLMSWDWDSPQLNCCQRDVWGVVLYYFNNTQQSINAEYCRLSLSTKLLCIHRTNFTHSTDLSLPCIYSMCLDHRAALPWPYGSSIDCCLYFFPRKHNASQRPNCPWRAKIIVYNRPSTCNDKSAMMCFRV